MKILPLPSSLALFTAGALYAPFASALPSFIGTSQSCVSVATTTTCDYFSEFSPGGNITSGAFYQTKAQANADHYSISTVKSGFGNLGVQTNSYIDGTIGSPTRNVTNAIAFASFADDIYIGSDTLLIGTIVDINLSNKLNATIASFSSYPDKGNPAALGYAGLDFSYKAYVVDGETLMDYRGCFGTFNYGMPIKCGTAGTDPFSFVFGDLEKVRVGDTIRIESSLSGHTEAILYNAAADLIFSGTAEGNVYSLNSLHTFIKPADDTYLQSASGHNYLAPDVDTKVPEPSSISLMLGSIGLMLITTLRRRYKK